MMKIQSRRTRRITAAALLTFALVASACSSTGDNAETTEGSTDSVESTTTTAADTTTTTAPADEATTSSSESTTTTAAGPLVDTADWVPCGEIECATVDVPADYEDPSLGTISIAINRVPAADPANRIGVLMVNPGGPGASGLGLSAAFGFGVFPQALNDRFDVIGFDPRGVAQSAPEFACGASGEQLAVLADVEDIYDTPEEIAAGEAAVALCVESMGALAGRIHTDYVVRDMDEIRQAIGEEQISFLGYSYGSLIGTWYATLFPDNVRSMVIDGADNPLDEEATFEERLESAREEIQPIEGLLGEALAACNDSTCPIFNDGDPVGFYFDAAEKFDLINEANANNDDTAFLAVITPLYQQRQWPELWDALAALEERDDPSLFSELAQFQLGPDPGAVNITAHINCLDSWALRPEKTREVRLAESAEFFEIEDELIAEFPLLGAIDSSSPGTCTFYDDIAPTPLAVPLDGGGVPILVIGNVSDPVTSFGESEELATEILADGRLVRVDHPDHTVFPFNSCVNDAVESALVDAVYPPFTVDCEFADGGLPSLERACFETVPEVDPQISSSLNDDMIEDICDGFVMTAVDQFGEVAIGEALAGSDDEVAEGLVEMLRELTRQAVEEAE